MNSAQGNTRLARAIVWVAAVCNVVGLLLWCPLASASAGAMVLMLLLALVANSAVGAYAVSQGLVFELMIERKWKKVCRGIGFVGEGRLQFKPRVAFDPLNSIQKGRWERKTIYPKLRDVRGTRESWTGIVHPFYGQDVDDYNQKASRFALCFHVPFFTCELDESGLIRVRAGQVPVPDAYSFTGQLQAPQTAQNTRVLQQTAPSSTLSLDEVPPGVLRAAHEFAQKRGMPTVPSDSAHKHQERQQENVWEYELSLLQGVPMAKGLNGRVCRIPIESNHWFIAARTGGGKSSWIFSLVLGLLPAWRAGLVKFWAIDPKMCELGLVRDWWAHYADDDKSSVELLEKAVDEMHARLRSMQGISRKFMPTVKTPLNVIIIDEMGYLAAYMADKKLRDRADTAVRALLAKGRAPGFAVVGAVQDPRVETCGYRNQFSIRIAGGLNESRQVDMVLGEGMKDFAHCEQIPLSEPGVAYVISERTQKPICVRAAWCSDDDIRDMLQSASLPLYQPMSQPQGVKDENLSGQLDWNSQPWL